MEDFGFKSKTMQSFSVLYAIKKLDEKDIVKYLNERVEILRNESKKLLKQTQKLESKLSKYK
jgi:hypothetical protein